MKCLEVKNIDFSFDNGHYKKEYWGKFIYNENDKCLYYFTEDGTNYLIIGDIYGNEGVSLKAKDLFNMIKEYYRLKELEKQFNQQKKLSIQEVLQLADKLPVETIIYLKEKEII